MSLFTSGFILGAGIGVGALAVAGGFIVLGLLFAASGEWFDKQRKK